MFKAPKPPDPNQVAAAQARENRINVFSPTGAQIYGQTTLDESGNPVFTASGDNQASVQLVETPFQQGVRQNQEAVATNLTDLAQTRSGDLSSSFGGQFAIDPNRTPAQVTHVDPNALHRSAPNNSGQINTFSNVPAVDNRSLDVIEARDRFASGNEINGLARGIDPRTSHMQHPSNRAGEFVRGIDPRTTDLQNAYNRAGEFTRSVDDRVRGIQGSINDRSAELDRRLSTQGLHGLSTTGDFGSDAAIARNAVFNLGKAQLDPVFKEERERAVTDLTNRGIPVGSEAWNREMNRLDRSQGQQLRNLSNQSVAAGGAEQSRLFNIASTARGQQFGERQAQAGFRNAATQQATNLEQQAADFRNRAVNQMLGQEIAAGNFRNTATAMTSAEERAAAGFNNAVQGQAFQQELAANQFANQAAAMTSAEDRAAAGFNNAVQGQAFQQELAANQFQNQAAGQAQSMGLAALGASLNATNASQSMQERLRNLEMQRQAAQNSAIGQQFGQNMQAAQFENAAGQQDFANRMSAAQFQNAQRNSAIQEQLLTRNQNINEVAQLLGAAPSMPLPQMMTNPGQVDVITPTYAGYNAQVNQAQGNMAGLFGLGQAGITAAMLCWVAREVYGPQNPRWLDFREWMLIKAPAWLRRWYIRKGPAVAEWLRDKPVFKRIVRGVMEMILKAEGK